MEESKDISYEGNTIKLQNDTIEGSLLPEKASELDRTIILLENTIIEGALYANKLEIQQGPVSVSGAVFVKSDLYVNSEAEGNISFKKTVGSSGSVTSRATQSHLTFHADLNAREITLYNAFIAGSIYADNITLENCIVIGGVFATSRLELINCMVGTFNSPIVKVSQQLQLLFPSAFSIEKLHILPDTKLYNLTFADLGALYKGQPEASDSGKIEMSPEADELETILTQAGTEKTVRSYSITGRVLAAGLSDTDKFQNHFLLTAAALGPQLIRDFELDIEHTSDSVSLTFEKIREFFFNILHGKTKIRNMTAMFNLKEITERFS